MRPGFFAVAGGAGLAVALVVRTTLRAPVFDASASEGPALLVSHPRGLVLFAALAGGALLGHLAARRGQAALVTPFAMAGLSGAVLVPGAFAVAPFLAAFSGRFLDLLLLISFLVSVWRFSEQRGFEPRRIRAAHVLAAALVLYLVLGARLQRDVGLSGDEPHYVLIAYSLVHDGDLRVQNNYGDEDYRSFYDGKIGPHLAAGSPYSVHGIGMPLVIAPGFAILGLSGVLLTEALLAALLLREVFLLGLALTSSRSAALLGVAALGLTAPGLFLSVSTYPELGAALVVAAVARRALGDAPPRSGRSAVWALVAGSLPFLHVKFLPLAAVLWAALLASVWRRNRGGVLAVLGGAAASLALLIAFSYAVSGSPSPTASYGRQRVFADRIPEGTAGLFFDQEFGLLPNAPVYLLGIAGILSLRRRHPGASALVVLVLGSVLLPGAAHPLWSGGTSPPARFLFPALPLLAVSAAAAFAARPRRGLAWWEPALLGASVGLAAAMALLPGQPLYLNGRNGRGRIWEALSSSWDVTAYLPSVVEGDARSMWVVAACAGFALALVASRRWLRARSMGLPLLSAALLVFAWVQDGLGARPSRALEAPWSSRVLHQLWDRSADTFVLLPAREVLSASDVMERVRLPLRTFAADGDPRHWWSRPHAIPAGRFRIDGVERVGAALWNGPGRIASEELTFRTAPGLSQFRLRARSLRGVPRLRMLAAAPTRFVAVSSIALGGGSRLHGLDDDAYLDPRGYWVKSGRKAEFLLEPAGEGCAGGCRLELSNGGLDNVVAIESASGTERLRLDPWASRQITLRSSSELVRFSVESERGFRPADHDPASGDRRELGVFLRAPGAL